MFAHAFSVLAWAAADQAVSSLEYGVIAAGTVVVVATAATTPANHVFARGPVRFQGLVAASVLPWIVWHPAAVAERTSADTAPALIFTRLDLFATSEAVLYIHLYR
jgi:hypothetical protein